MRDTRGVVARNATGYPARGMNLSYQRVLALLDGRAPSVEDVERALIHAGFPVESREAVGDDWRLDVEITSNRGDCLSHAGLAREIAANLDLRLKDRAGRSLDASPDPVGKVLALEVRTPAECPRFTARVIAGVRVGPSPAWLCRALESVGQRPINNVVDVTNFVCSEYGNPCHAFDLDKLAGGRLVVRFATAGEGLTTLDGKRRTLAADDVVVADADRAQSLAGVIGGADSEVDATTKNVVFEMATWEPVAVRRAARRHQVRTDASHRFERYVDARTIDAAAREGAAMIAEVCGGRVLGGLLDAGAPARANAPIRLRPGRCNAILGFETSPAEMAALLGRLGIACEPSGEALACVVPVDRADLTREIDLIEEVGRLRGLEAVPVRERIAVEVRPPQASESARREAGAILTGLGFYEAITFSFTGPKTAAAFLPPGMKAVSVDDARRGGEPTLRPSVLTGLLASRRANQHARVSATGGVRLFEIGAVFGESDGASVENLNLALLADVRAKGRTPSITETQDGLRLVRGAVEALTRDLAGATATIVPATPHAGAFAPGAYASVTLGGKVLGYYGLVAPAVQAVHDLDAPVVGCELNLGVLTGAYPPVGRVAMPPEFPATDRDISVVVPERVRWDEIERAVREAARPPFESVAFVTTYRGAQIGAGNKSVTMRLVFRDETRTLKREEVEAPVAAMLAVLKDRFGAGVRA